MKKVLSKERFIDIINALQKESDTISELYRKYNIDIINCDWNQSDYFVVKLLQYIFDDEDNDVLSWWCWETDFGRDLPFLFYTENGEEIEEKLDTVEKLYDYLVLNMKESEENK